MKKKTLVCNVVPLFKDEIKSISIKELDKHLRKIRKRNKLYEDLLKDLPGESYSDTLAT
jgi:hypothetical protein